MSFSVKIPANIYLYLQINALLACIKVRGGREKCGIKAYLSALVQLSNIRDQKPTIRDLETQHKQKLLFLVQNHFIIMTI